MKFDCIVVLSAAARNIDGLFPDFLDGKYLGGGARVQAAAELTGRYPETPFVVVGGYNEKNVGIAGTSKKVDDIVDYLKHKRPTADIQQVYSLPCTHHNFVALCNNWKSNKVYPRSVGVLTNAYHLPRALVFAAMSAASILPDRAITFTPITAEDFASADTTGFSDFEVESAIAKREALEKAGLEMVQTGRYADYCLTRDFAFLKDLMYENPDSLLTPEERDAL